MSLTDKNFKSDNFENRNMLNHPIRHVGILLALLQFAIPVSGQTPQETETVTAAEITATQAAIEKRGPRVTLETYRKIVPAYLSKSGELTPQGSAVLGGDPKTQKSTVQTSSATDRGTKYEELIGSWKTGTTSAANGYEFQDGGRVIRSFQSFTGKDGKYTGTKTEDFQALQEAGKIIVTPKGEGSPYPYWFEIAVPFNPDKPSATFYRVNGDKHSETPFYLVKALPEPKREASLAGTVQRTMAKRAVVIGPDKRRYFEQGSPVEILMDRTGLPEWAEAVVIKGRPGQPDERWLIPAEWLTEGESFEKKSNASNPAFPPSKRLESQYLEIERPYFISGSSRRSFVLMPGARVRVVKREQTSDQYGNIPGFEIRDGWEGLTAILPEIYFVNNGADFRPLPPATTAKLSGNGTKQSPYLIRSRQDFLAYCQDPFKWESGVHARLESDIDLSGIEFEESLIAPLDRDDGLSPDEKPAFKGVFDGNHKMVTALHVSTNRPYANAALFQVIGPEGIVRDLSVEAAKIETKGLNSGAAILCFSNKGLIQNCRVKGQVSTASGLGSAGLCVENRETGKIVESFVGEGGKTTISGWQAGGLCSLNEGLIERSGANAEMRGHQSGGLVSANQRGTLRNCFATGKIVDSASIGGLCATNSGLIENCFSRTELIPEESRKNDVSGGLVARSSGPDARVTSSYWDINASGTHTSQGGKGISAPQNREQETFPGWDFNTIWSMGANGPELRIAAISR